MDCSPPGSSVHGNFQARILEWVVISFSRASSQPRDQTQVSHIAGGFFTDWAAREALCYVIYKVKYIRLKMLPYYSKPNFSLESTVASDYTVFFLSYCACWLATEACPHNHALLLSQRKGSSEFHTFPCSSLCCFLSLEFDPIHFQSLFLLFPLKYCPL